jgi:primosomal replication protein N
MLQQSPQRPGPSQQEETPMGRHILVVMTNAVEGKDQEFNHWYSNVHLGEVVAIPGFVSAQRYKLADSEIAGERFAT